MRSCTKACYAHLGLGQGIADAQALRTTPKVELREPGLHRSQQILGKYVRDVSSHKVKKLGVKAPCTRLVELFPGGTPPELILCGDLQQMDG